jgi:hypothetical protein
MLDDAEADEFEAVVAESLDRFRRNITDAFTARQRLRDANKKLHIVSFGTEDLTLDSGAGLWLFTFGSAQSQAESETFKLRGAKGHRTKIARGQWNGGRSPTGYSPVSRGEGERTASLVKDPEYEAHIQFLWDRLLDGDLGNDTHGWATYRIARALTERGCKPPMGGARFGQPSVSNIARNPIYAGCNWAYDENGKKIPGKLGIEGDWEAYVTPEQWEAVQRRLRGRNNVDKNGDSSTRRKWGRPSKSFLLAGGLGTCGECGGSLWTKKDKYSDYYACRSIKEGQPCGMPRISREKVDLAVRRYIVHGPDLMNVSAALDRAWDFIESEEAATSSKVAQLQVELAKHQRAIDALEKRDLVDDDGEIDETLVQLLRTKRRLLAGATEQLAEAQEAAEAIDDAASRPSKRVAAKLIAAYREQFERDAELGLEDLQARLRSSVDYVVVKYIPQPQAIYDDAFNWRNDPAKVAIRIHWRGDFVDTLVSEIDPSWLGGASRETDAAALRRSRRRHGGNRGRDPPPRCGP